MQILTIVILVVFLFPVTGLQASAPVEVIITGCVQEGIIISESTDFGTHQSAGKYQIRPMNSQGQALDLGRHEGRRISISGYLLPGDSFYADESSIVDQGPCAGAEIRAPRTKTFANPMVHGLALDFCQFWGDGCGQPAADAWCLSQGYERALRYEVQVDTPPTRIIATGQTCDQEFCDRIVAVTCVEMTGGWYRHAQQYAGLGGTP
jgi:hypothetical protein